MKYVQRFVAAIVLLVGLLSVQPPTPASAATDCEFDPTLCNNSGGTTDDTQADEGPFDPLGQACKQTPDSTACKESQKGQEADNANSPVTKIVNDVANIIAVATAVISVIVIVVAGFTVVLSTGESAKVSSARDAIIYAAVGLAVVAMARSVVVFIVNRL